MITLFTICDMIKMLGIAFGTIIALVCALGIGYWLGCKVHDKFFDNN